MFYLMFGNIALRTSEKFRVVIIMCVLSGKRNIVYSKKFSRIAMTAE